MSRLLDSISVVITICESVNAFDQLFDCRLIDQVMGLVLGYFVLMNTFWSFICRVCSNLASLHEILCLFLVFCFAWYCVFSHVCPCFPRHPSSKFARLATMVLTVQGTAIRSSLSGSVSVTPAPR